MRPTKIKVSAFGPYAGEVSIDMTTLGSNGIYLITGDTGAGKTTIFDAISFALFGEASGDIRTNSEFRSKYAKPETKTFVAMEFEYDGKIYRVKRNPEYMRPKTHGDGETKESANAELICPDGRVVSKQKEVTKEIEQLLGVNKNQFSQICMIAQGDFRKLLDTDTKDRVKIFRHIFKTENFQKIQEQVTKNTKELYIKKEDIKKSVNQYIGSVKCDETDVIYLELLKAQVGEMLTEDAVKLIESIIDIDEKGLAVVNEKIASITEELTKVNAKIELVKSQNESKKQFENNKVLLNELAEKQKQAKAKLDEEKPRQEEKKKFEKEIALIKEKLPKFDDLSTLIRELSALTKEVTEINSFVEENSNLLEVLIKKITDDEEKLKTLRDVNVDLEKAKSAVQNLLEKSNKIASIDAIYSKYLDATSKLKTIQEDARLAIEKANSLSGDYNSKNALFLAEQAGIIAESLVDGIPCPVCGSTEHPMPAKKAENAPTEDDVKNAQKLANEANKEAQNLSEEAKTKIKEVEMLEQNLIEKASDVIAEFNIENVKSLIERAKQDIDDELQIAKQKENDLVASIKIKEALEESLPKSKTEKDLLEKNIQEKKTRQVQISTLAEEKLIQANKLKDDLGFESKVAAQNKIIELQANVDLIEKAFEQATKDLADIDKNISELNGQQEGLKKALENTVDYDENELVEQQIQLLEEKKNLDTERDAINSRIDNNKDNLNNINLKSSELIDVEKEYVWMNSLANTVNGQISGKERIQLETYVQMSYFDRIINKANTRLLMMTDNQYELKRREDNKLGGQVGLDLDVIDHYNGTTRTVASLSGGESFKASLSLALGLSDEVQSSAGGIKIDTMFVDEGFGSLDDESLQQALKALTGLSDGNRLVGIISHVAALNEKIDNKIIVKKDRENGSFVRIETQ